MNLYRPEWMKLRLSAYLRAVSGIFISLLSLGILFLFLFQIESGNGGASDEADLFADWNGLLSLTTALSFACYSVFSAVVASKVIVSEYCGSNAAILLSCPVRRTDLFRVKCLLVCGITAVCAWCSNVLIIGIMYVTAQIFGTGPQMHAGYFSMVAAGAGVLMGLLASAVGMLSAFFGYIRRSPTASVVCAVILVCAATNVIVIAPEHLTGVLLLMAAVFLSITGLILRIMADHVKQMEV